MILENLRKNMATLKVNNLTKDFGNTKVLKQINLEVSDGEFIVLLGLFHFMMQNHLK